MHQMIGAGRANVCQVWHVLTAGKVQHICALFKTQNLTFLCRDQPTYHRACLRRNTVALPRGQWLTAEATKEWPVSTDDTRLHKCLCLTNRGDRGGIAGLVGVAPRD